MNQLFQELTLEVRQTLLFGGQAVEFVVAAAVAAVYDVVVMVEAVTVIEFVWETDEELVGLVVLVT